MIPMTVAVQTECGDLEAWVSGEDAAIAADDVRVRQHLENLLLPVELSRALPARLYVLCEVGGERVFAANGEVPYARMRRDARSRSRGFVQPH
ncbi:hypothetical protein [Burkholderia cepacia]|uniref:hypothetical protein n=1 Tax=Burkholderia cepacia TaxID=292 RepID=UPI002AB60818|nr:hypothetical protein [Burkholderia cepacia]